LKNEAWLKIAVSGIAAGAIVVRLLFPALRIDAVSLGLLVLGILPWLSPLIKSAELPGGWKIQFQDVKEAAEKVTGPGAARALSVTAEPAQEDPNLALVGLRIEIERRLRALAKQAGVAHSLALSRLTEELEEQGILDEMEAGGLKDLITYGNRAAHGVEIAPAVARSAVEYGPSVLAALDKKLVSTEERTSGR
jgi:hypothetical protein